ncbi:MAG: NADH-quinone oxidoreductase subunit L [Candidatus Binatia bacterium]
MEDVTPTSLLRWIPILPLVTAFVGGLFGAKIQKSFGKQGIAALAVTPVALSFLLSVVAFFRLLGLDPEHRVLLDSWFTWISIGTLRVDVAFLVDPLSAVMILVVTGVGGLIHVYSIGYMHEDNAFWRFFAYLNLFMFSMLVLVLADNLLLLFVGWEGVGLCSYALIGFWYKDLKNCAAGTKAFLVNRIGDFGFALGVFLLFWALDHEGHGTVVFREITHHVGSIADMTFRGWSVPALVGLLLFVGAAGKSAQIPLYVWLPDAKAGPTPVSALIHAATMVTAGVYMVARMNAVYSVAPDALLVVAWIGAATAVFAATIGLAQNDIKKVLAYSTVSQLGYMFLGLGVGAYAAGIFHLMTHAFFKACLFLGSGSVIHAMGGEQDMRKMGGLRHPMPRPYWTFLIATLALAGFPLTAGFFSKDEILWKAYSSELGDPWLWRLGVAGAALTAFYMTRQVCMVFFGESRADEHTKHHLHESPPVMTVPLLVLAGGALVVGWLGMPAWMGPNAFEHFLEPVFSGAGHAGAVAHGAHETALAHHDVGTELGVMLVSIGLAAASALVAIQIYGLGRLRLDRLVPGPLYRLVANKYYVDEIYEATVVRLTLFAAWLGAMFDRYVIDGIVDGSAAATRGWSAVTGLFDFRLIDGAVNAIADVTLGWGNRLRHLQTGGINAYLYGIVVAVTAVLVARLW